MREYLIIIEGYNPATSMLETLYYSTRGFTSSPTDSVPNTFFEPRIKNPALYAQSMYSIGTTSGGSTGGYGNIELLNTDGGLDNLTKWGFDGNTCAIYEGDANGTFADFGIVLSGTIEQVEFNWSSLIIRYKDRTTEIDKPLQPTKYLGNNVLPLGLEGIADLLGKPKPRMFGRSLNITPVLVNTSKLIYQVNDGAILDITAVRDTGVPLTLGTTYADSATMIVATPAVGTYNVCLSEGYFRLGSTPFGQITVDANSIVQSIGQTIKVLAIEKLGATSIVEQSIIDLDKMLPATVKFQYYSGANEVTTKFVIDELCKCGIWWGFDNNGKFWAKQFSAPPPDNPIIYLTNDDILDIERVATNDGDRGVPVWRVVCRYARNNTVQTTVAGSVAAAVYDKEWKEVVHEDASIKIIHPLASELIIDSAFTEYSDALAEATRQFNLRSVNRDRLRVTIPMFRLSYSEGGYWDNEAITEMPGYYYNMGAAVVDNKLFIAGGVSKNPTLTISRKAYSLNLDNPTEAYGVLPDIPITKHSYPLLNYDGFIYIYGGLGYSFPYRLDLSNPIAWDETGLSSMPDGRYNYGGCVYDNKLFVFGGFNVSGGAVITSCYYHDLSVFPHPDAGWESTAPFNSHQWVSLPAIPITSPYVGSFLYGSIFYYITTTETVSIDLTNPNIWTMNALPALPVSFIYSSPVIKDNMLYLIGGLIGTTILDTVYSIDMDAKLEWVANITPLPAPRTNSSAVYHNGSVYLIGGLTTIAENNTWRLRTNDDPQDIAALNSIGRTALLTIPRYGYDTGKPMRIIGAEHNYETNKITLELWG